MDDITVNIAGGVHPPMVLFLMSSKGENTTTPNMAGGVHVLCDTVPISMGEKDIGNNITNNITGAMCIPCNTGSNINFSPHPGAVGTILQWGFTPPVILGVIAFSPF